MKTCSKTLVVVIGLLMIAGVAVAQKAGFRSFGGLNFFTPLSGDGEVPPVDTLGRGNAIFSANANRTEINYKVLVANVKNMTQAHIHCGAADVNGPVVIFLFGLMPAGENLNGILAQGTVTADDLIVRPDSEACPGGIGSFEELIARMEAGETYANVHTIDNPGGEIRGQIESTR